MHKSLREIIAIFKALDLNLDILLTRESLLYLFDFTLKFAKHSEVLANISIGLLLVVLDQVVHHGY